MESLYREATQLQQERYLFISDYNEAIENIVKQMSVCKQWSHQTTLERHEEYFYLGLSNITRLELSKANISGVENILKFIQNTESLLIKLIKENNNTKLKNEIYNNIHPQSQLNERINNYGYNRNGYNRSYRFPNQRRQFDDLEKHNQYSRYQPTYRYGDQNSSYRRYNNQRGFENRRGHDQRHYFERNSNNHSGNGYKSQQNENNNEKFNNRNFAVKETYTKLSPIILKGKVKETTVECLLDSGNNDNYMDSELVKTLNLEISNIPEKTIEMANKKQEVIDKATDVLLQLEQTPNVEYKLRASLMSSISVGLILGVEFLQKFSCILDFSTPRLLIDDVEIELEKNQGFWKGSPDETMSTKSKACQVFESPKEEMNRLIQKAKAKNPYLGLIKGFQHEIKLLDETPFGCSGYTIPMSLEKAMDEEIERLLKYGIIQPSRSEFISPCFPILKRNGNIRLIIDYRKLNSVSVKDCYPIPEVKEKLLRLRGSSICSTIDLNMGYYQLSVKEESRKYTAFVVNHQVYEFTRMPFGLTNAPRSFQRAINEMLRNLTNIEVFMDDL